MDSVARQLESILGWCKSNSAQLVAFHCDISVSGATKVAVRPGLLAALGDLQQRNASVLLVTERDRLARDMVVARGVDELAAECASASVVETEAAGLAGARVILLGALKAATAIHIPFRTHAR